MRLLSNLFAKFIHNGTLHLTDADGGVHEFGGKGPGPAVRARLHDRSLHTKLVLNPELYAGEAYMDGTFTFEGGSTIDDFLLLFSVNRAGLGAHASQKLLRQAWRGLKRWHKPIPSARQQ